MEKDKVPARERGTIRAVVLDDEGFADIAAAFLSVELEISNDYCFNKYRLNFIWK